MKSIQNDKVKNIVFGICGLIMQKSLPSECIWFGLSSFKSLSPEGGGTSKHMKWEKKELCSRHNKEVIKYIQLNFTLRRKAKKEHK